MRLWEIFFFRVTVSVRVVSWTGAKLVSLIGERRPTAIPSSHDITISLYKIGRSLNNLYLDDLKLKSSAYDPSFSNSLEWTEINYPNRSHPVTCRVLFPYPACAYPVLLDVTPIFSSFQGYVEGTASHIEIPTKQIASWPFPDLEGFDSTLKVWIFNFLTCTFSTNSFIADSLSDPRDVYVNLGALMAILKPPGWSQKASRLIRSLFARSEPTSQPPLSSQLAMNRLDEDILPIIVSYLPSETLRNVNATNRFFFEAWMKARYKSLTFAKNDKRLLNHVR